MFTHIRVTHTGVQRYLRLQGQYQHLRHKPSPARKQWIEAIDHAERLSMPGEAALAQLLMGTHLGMEEVAAVATTKLKHIYCVNEGDLMASLKYLQFLSTI